MLFPLAAALAACGGSEEATTVSIQGDNGSTVASLGKDGRVEINTPGFQGSIKLPKFTLGADNFEVDGLKLFPGSSIASLNVEKGKNGGDGVRVEFDAPAARAEVQSWFQDKMKAAGFNVQASDGTLAGTTSDGSKFSLKLDPQGDDKSHGTLSVAAN